MMAKRIVSLLLAAVVLCSAFAMPALAATTLDDEAAKVTLGETNDIVSIRITADGELVYGSPLTLRIETSPANTQYLGVIVGISGKAKGFVTLSLSDKIRTLLKLIPLPKVMSATPEQEEEFNVYAYIKQLIDGNDVSVLLRVADEAVSVMDVLEFYVPTLKDVSDGMKQALDLIRQFLPEDSGTRIYLDEQPTDSGNYIAGAVALEAGDINTAGVAMFSIKPRSEGVSLQWSATAPASMTAAELQSFDSTAIATADGQVLTGVEITYTYKKSGLLDWVGSGSEEVPTEAGEYTQTAKLSGNYSCSSISRKIKITG